MTATTIHTLQTTLDFLRDLVTQSSCDATDFWRSELVERLCAVIRSIEQVMGDPTGVTGARGAPESDRAIMNLDASDSMQHQVQCTFDRLRAQSTADNPYCFRCGEAGHRARICRNVVLCFICNRLGHMSFQCRAVVTSSQVCPPKLIILFRSDLCLDEMQISGEAYSSGMLAGATSIHYFELAMVKRFGLSPAASDLNLGYGDKLQSCWIKVKGFPLHLWQREEFEKLIEDFGEVLEMDRATEKHMNFKEAKLRIGVKDLSHIPTVQTIFFLVGPNEWRWATVTYEMVTQQGRRHGARVQGVWVNTGKRHGGGGEIEEALDDGESEACASMASEVVAGAQETETPVYNSILIEAKEGHQPSDNVSASSLEESKAVEQDFTVLQSGGNMLELSNIAKLGTDGEMVAMDTEEGVGVPQTPTVEEVRSDTASVKDQQIAQFWEEINARAQMFFDKKDEEFAEAQEARRLAKGKGLMYPEEEKSSVEMTSRNSWTAGGLQFSIPPKKVVKIMDEIDNEEVADEPDMVEERELIHVRQSARLRERGGVTPIPLKAMLRKENFLALG